MNEKNVRGITLIALVITVLVLLIIAGVTVSLALNQDNVFEKANEAKKEWNEKVSQEEAKLTNYISYLNDIAPDITKDRYYFIVTNFFEAAGRFCDDGFFYFDDTGSTPQGSWSLNGKTLSANGFGANITLSWNGEKFIGEFSNGDEEPLPASLTKIDGFKFKINGVEYIADEGSNWRDWLGTVDAKRSGYKFGNNGVANTVMDSNGNIVMTSPNSFVFLDDQIEPGATYICELPDTY